MSTAAVLAELGPYLVVIVAGFLPNEMWRMLAVFASRGLAEGSDVLDWVRFVAAALVAGVVAQLVFEPPGALAAVPAWGRFGALALGLGAYWALGRRVLAGLVAGETAILMLAWVYTA
jgi:hypothetical protein